MKLKLTNVRLAFANIFVAKAVEAGQEPRFGASLLIDPATQAPLLAQINKEIDAVALAKWGAKYAPILAMARKTDKVCLHDGNLKAQYAGFEDMMYVSASNKMRPVAVNRDTSPVSAEDGVIYSGCYVNATVELWAQDNKYGKRVNATLLGVQFSKAGDAFSGGSVGSADDFESIEEGVGADDLG
jgi:hypothetical protein